MIIFLIILGLLAAFVMACFNRLIRLKNLLKEAWSGIDVQLKRRHDLIPQIVETVKGYMTHERELLEKLTNIRSQFGMKRDAKDQSFFEAGVAGALKKMFVLAEGYPDLKASQTFLSLQKTLSEVEDQIQLARRYYNGTVRNYNILVESFPSNLIAGAFGFDPGDYFEIEYATERKNPDVRFPGPAV